MSPYHLDLPAIISFSGGRTSGYLLRQTLDAYGGRLPENLKVIFCNTGKERPETLDFVERCSLEWDVPIVWLEYRQGVPGRFHQVTYANASRKGEPFDQLIAWKQMLPNVAMRFCTQWLKIKVSNRYVRHVLGWTPKTGGYTNAIGLRYDEPHRVMRLRQDPKTTPGEEPIAPLHRARVGLEHVMDFWAGSPFDLALAPYEGNCDLCFLKGQGKLQRIMNEHPELAPWWIDKEQELVGKTDRFEAARFRKSAPSYQATLELAQQPSLLDLIPFDDYPECRCTD